MITDFGLTEVYPPQGMRKTSPILAGEGMQCHVHFFANPQSIH